jgi:ethanolamine ammonia-lyase small subunit
VTGLYAAYQRAGGDTRGADMLALEGSRALERLRARGLDLGYAHGPGFADPPAAASRIDALYRHARRALYATLDPGVLADSCPRSLRARTRCLDREEYLARPPSGERLRDGDVARIATLHPERRPGIQLVVSDGLNADAANEQLRPLLPRVRHGLQAAGFHVGAIDVVLDDARVRAGYHVGEVLDVPLIVHLIGERPGTGLNTLSAYLTYGRDEHGRSRWGPALEHSETTAICGIHPRANRPETAADEIVRTVARILEERRSGVALGGTSPA